jgi:hypothetical protein
MCSTATTRRPGATLALAAGSIENGMFCDATLSAVRPEISKSNKA